MSFNYRGAVGSVMEDNLESEAQTLTFKWPSVW